MRGTRSKLLRHEAHRLYLQTSPEQRKAQPGLERWIHRWLKRAWKRKASIDLFGVPSGR